MKKTFLLLAVLAPFVMYLIVFKTSLLNKKYEKIESIKIDNSNIYLKSYYSQGSYVGKPLIFYFNIGVDLPTKFEWYFNSSHFIFKTSLKPIVIANFKNTLYLVVTDQLNGFMNFIFYKYIQNKWVVINRNEFPSHLAFQNVYLGYNSYLNNIDFESPDFSISVNGQLWAYLMTGKNTVLDNKDFYINFAKENGITKEMLDNVKFPKQNGIITEKMLKR